MLTSKLHLLLGILGVTFAAKQNALDIESLCGQEAIDLDDLCFLPSGEAKEFPTRSFAAAVAASPARGGADLRRCRDRAAEAHADLSSRLAEAQVAAIALGVSLYDHLIPAKCAPSFCGCSSCYAGDGDAPVREACCGDGPTPIRACRDALQRKHDDLDAAVGVAFDALVAIGDAPRRSAAKGGRNLRGSKKTAKDSVVQPGGDESIVVGNPADEVKLSTSVEDVAGDYVVQPGGDEGIVVGNPADKVKSSTSVEDVAGDYVDQPGGDEGIVVGNPADEGIIVGKGVMSGNPGFLAKLEAASDLLDAHRRVRLDLDGLASSYSMGGQEGEEVCEDPQLRYYAEVAASPLAQKHACLRSLLDEATASLVATVTDAPNS